MSAGPDYCLIGSWDNWTRRLRGTLQLLVRVRFGQTKMPRPREVPGHALGCRLLARAAAPRRRGRGWSGAGILRQYLVFFLQGRKPSRSSRTHPQVYDLRCSTFSQDGDPDQAIFPNCRNARFGRPRPRIKKESVLSRFSEVPCQSLGARLC